MKGNSFGSGIAGIASAIRLQNKGYKVQILEKNSYPGGKLTQFNRNGFRFDAGPSLYHAKPCDGAFEISKKHPLIISILTN
jgi:phytoene dehydrogenase-like protein